MSLSATLSSAISGLNAASRQAEVASSNIANAMTESYGRRELHLGARQVGDRSNGVQIEGLTRRVNLTLLSERRVAMAGASGSATTETFLKQMETALGNSDDPSSLSARVSAFDTALVTATSRPDSVANLTGLANSARDLAQGLREGSNSLQAARMQADQQIAKDVDSVNTALGQVREMNIQIQAMQGAGQDPSGLMDQRQKLIDGIAEIVPLREAQRDHGQIALYTSSGAVLLDGAVNEIGFSPVGVITPDMTLTSGALSGLTLNGRPMPANGAGALLQGGRLAAQFAIRDDLAVQAQTNLDALARDLAGRFQDPMLDTTLAPGDAGLFTDQGAAFDPLNEMGLAQRLQLNSAVDPTQGGALWRLRDGVNATAPGAASHSTLLAALQDRLTESRTPASGDFMPGSRSFAGLVSEVTSGLASARLVAETDSSFAASKAETLKEAAYAEGVDTDQELQAMLEIERLYAANARVIQSVDSMLDELMRI